MQLTPLTAPRIEASELPLERLAASDQVSEAEKVGEMSRQFEAVLLRQILSEAHKTVIHSEFSDDSAVGGIYRDMVTTQLADLISQSGSFGLAQHLHQDLTRQLPTDAAGKDGPP
jgi:Rod binding domain-containing protein